MLSVSRRILSPVGVNAARTTLLVGVPRLVNSSRMVSSRPHHAHMPISPFRRFMPIQFVPEREAWVIERFGKFSRVATPGLMFMIPFADRVQYVHSLKVVPMEIPGQAAITQDNVTIDMDGVLYFQVLNPFKASYHIDDIDFAVSQMALSTMRAEIGKLPLERLFQERSKLNERIMEAINAVSTDWGVSCLRYEIRDISPPKSVLEAMELQVVAERRKREAVIYSEGQRQADINVAEGKKLAAILESEAQLITLVNTNKGEAESIRLRANATATGIKQLSDAIESSASGESAVKLLVAKQYLEAFAKLAQSSTTLLLPANANDPSAMVAQALAVFNKVSGRSKSTTSSTSTESQPKDASTSPTSPELDLPIPLDELDLSSTNFNTTDSQIASLLNTNTNTNTNTTSSSSSLPSNR